jgi:error-prone DNA polymerase
VECCPRGHSREFAERLCHQIEGFGKYGFPESHAASFALLVYSISLDQMSSYQQHFTVALLNAQPMGFYTPIATTPGCSHGMRFEIRPIDVNASEWFSTLENKEGSLHVSG